MVLYVHLNEEAFAGETEILFIAPGTYAHPHDMEVPSKAGPAEADVTYREGCRVHYHQYSTVQTLYRHRQRH